MKVVGFVAAALGRRRRAGDTPITKHRTGVLGGSSYPHHLHTFPSSSPSHAGSSSSTYPTAYGSTSTGSLGQEGFGLGSTRIHSSPERLRRNSLILNRVPEDGAMEFDHTEGTRYTSGVSLNEDVEDESERFLDGELEEHGLYRGSYWHLIAVYSLAPLTSIVAFILLAILPPLAYPLDLSRAPFSYPYSPYFPFPLPELLLSIALWSFTHLLRDPLFTLISFTSILSFVPSALPAIISTVLHTLASLVLQQSALPFLLVPHYTQSEYPTTEDFAFRRVWWLALGWAAAEAVAGVKQGYEAIALYRGALVTVHKTESAESRSRSDDSSRKPEDRSPGSRHDSPSASQVPLSTGGIPLAAAMTGAGQSTVDLFNQQAEDDVYGHPEDLDDEDGDNERQQLLPRRGRPNGRESQEESALKMQVDYDVEQLITIKRKEELEEAYGMPIIRIPIFISCLQRINSVLISLSIYLLISHAYIRSTVAAPPLHFNYEHGSLVKTNTPLLVTLPLVALVQFGLVMLHTPLLLPRLGIPTVVYIGSLISLGLFFTSLAVWEGLS